MKSKHSVVFWIWLMMVVAYIDRVNITVAGPVLQKDLHLSPTEFGLVLSSFTLGYALLQIPGGYLADRFGARTPLVAAILIWSLFTALTGLATSLPMLIAIRILFGMGEGIENGAQFKLIGDYFNSRERSSANAFFLTALALGPALCLPAATWTLQQVGWRHLFLVFSVPGILVAMLLARFLPAPREQSPEIPEESAVDWKYTLRQSRPGLAFSAYLCFNIAFWGFIGWMPTYLNKTRHIELASLGWPASVPYFCGFVGLVVMGQLGSRALVNYRPILIGIGYLIAGGSLYLAFSASTVPLSIAGLSLAAFFLYGGFGPFWAIALDLIPATSRGAFSGFINFGGQIGGFLAPIVVGRIFDITRSFTGGFLFMIGALILAALCLFRLQIGSDRVTR